MDSEARERIERLESNLTTLLGIVGTLADVAKSHEQRLDTMTSQIGALATEMGTLTTGMSTLTTRMSTLTTEMGTLTTGMSTLTTGMSTLATGMGTLAKRSDTFDERMDRLAIAQAEAQEEIGALIRIVDEGIRNNPRNGRGPVN
ncbi:MAG: hypothetical protein ACRD44_03355 [Bryobacteraceae bacterium]